MAVFIIHIDFNHVVIQLTPQCHGVARTGSVETLFGRTNMRNTEMPIEALFLGQVECPENSVRCISVGRDGTEMYVGLAGGLVERSTLNKQEEQLWRSAIWRKPLLIKVRNDDVWNLKRFYD